jgi:hypothetical protein
MILFILISHTKICPFSKMEDKKVKQGLSGGRFQWERERYKEKRCWAEYV